MVWEVIIMATVTQNGSVLNVALTGLQTALTIDISLQRHHYAFCAGANAEAVNSLFFSTVTVAQVIADCQEVGTQIERLLLKNFRPQVMFGVTFTTASQRGYLVDNSALDANSFPNHFYVVSGPGVWGQMTQAEFVAARDVRRVEEAIAARSDKDKFLDPKQFLAFRQTPGAAANPVVQAYAAAAISVRAAANSIDHLVAVSGQPKIMTVIQAVISALAGH
jgi:hypothetical protein